VGRGQVFQFFESPLCCSFCYKCTRVLNKHTRGGMSSCSAGWGRRRRGRRVGCDGGGFSYLQGGY
jgi:hypothetical protein